MRIIGGLSTDTKPTAADVYPGDRFIESDTGNQFVYDGDSWAIDTCPAYLEFTGSAGTNDNDVIYTSGDVSAYNYHLIEATAGTVDVDVSGDGTNWIAAVAGVSVVTTTPATRVVEAAAGVMLQITGQFKKIRVNQKGAVASNARGAHGRS